jgi:hypothetical protein
MSLVNGNLARGLFLTGVALGVLASAGAGAADPGSPRRGSGIHFTEPDASVTSTNSLENSAKRTTFAPLGPTVRKPFEFFKPEDSFSGVLAPPPQPMPPPALHSRRAKELLDRKKNWVFNTPEEMYGVESPEEMSSAREYGPNGELKKPKTVFERYVARMEKARADATTNQVASGGLPGWLKAGERDEKTSAGADDRTTGNSIFGNLDANAQRPSGSAELTGLFGAVPGTAEKNVSDFFSFGSSDAGDRPFAKDAARAARMQEFKQLLESGSPVSPGLGAGFGIAAPGNPSGAAAASPFPAGTFGRDPFGLQPAARPASLPSTYPGTTLPGFNTPVFVSPPAAPASRALTPPAAVFELPKSKY